MSRPPAPRRRLRWRLALGMTALALGLAALVGLAAAGLGRWLADDPSPETVTRVEQVGDRLVVVQIDESGDTAAAAEAARRDGLRWLLVSLAVAFVPAAAGAWVLAGRLLRPVEQVAEVVARVDAPGGAGRVGLDGRDDEVGRLAGALDGMLDRLEQREHDQEARLQEVVHELRTPLAVASANLELAAADPAAGADLGEQVAAARRALERMQRTVDDLAAHRRLALANGAGAVDLAVEARHLAAEHAGPARQRGIQVVAGGAEAVPVPADRDGLRTAVGNVLANAVRLAPSGSTITVGWGRHARWGWVAVRDEGPGIAPALHHRVFERHWRGRADIDRDGDAGAQRGLGLTIARQAVEAQGGHLTVASSEGGGSTFTVWLPAGVDALAGDVVAPDGVHAVVDPLALAAAT